MKSPIISAASRLLLPFMLLYGVALLLIGHNKPGGGFSGGLVVAATLALRSIASDPQMSEHPLHILRRIIAAGLLVSVVAAALPVFFGNSILTNLSFGFSLPPNLHPDVSLLFDIGVFTISAAGALLVLESIIWAGNPSDRRPDQNGKEGRDD